MTRDDLKDILHNPELSRLNGKQRKTGSESN